MAGWTTPKDWTTDETLLESDFDAQFRDNLAFLKANVAWDSALELTIASGVITKAQSHHTVDTEGGAGTDELNTISGCSEGDLFLLRPAYTDRTVVMKHGTGNIELPNGLDYSMDTTEKAALCFYQGSKVLVIGMVGILYVPRTYHWFISGTVSTGTEQGPTYRMKRATTVEDIELHIKTAPTGAALIVDINEGGTTLFSTNPEIDDGGTVEDDNHVFSDTALAAGAELTLDIDQVGSGEAGVDLTILLHCKEAVI